jgi:hypothetical protein
MSIRQAADGCRGLLCALSLLALAPETTLARQKEDGDDNDAPAAAVIVAQNVWSDEQFEGWVFQDYNSGPGEARRKYDALLNLQVEEIDRVCRLTEEQKKKLQLIGRGDIKRLFDAFEKAKHRFKLLNNDVQRLQEIMKDVSPLQTMIQAGLFEGKSLFSRSLHHTLTAEQIVQYESVAQERRAFRHRAQIELAVDFLEQSVPLRDAQRRQVIDLLIKETKAPRMATDYGMYLVIYRLGRMPEEKVKPLFTNVQWPVVKQFLNQYRGMVGNLREDGVMIDEDEPAAPPAKK